MLCVRVCDIAVCRIVVVVVVVVVVDDDVFALSQDLPFFGPPLFVEPLKEKLVQSVLSAKGTSSCRCVRL
jgi:hypothetical protein